jgi:prephenate dehydrogenase
MGAVDRIEPDPRDAVKGAGLVIIATPVRSIATVLEQIGPALEEGTVVTDTGSTKSDVLRWAQRLLPGGVSFVGGHPMAGKETQGIQAAEAALFREKIYCVIPSVDAPERAIRTVLGLVETLGATAWFIDADEHDQYVAAISHVPLVASAALFAMARGSKAWNDLAPLASSGFRDTTRLASGDPDMAADIFATNRQAVVHWLDRFLAELQAFRDLVASESEVAEQDHDKRLTTAQLQREEFLVGRFDRGAPRAPIDLPSTSTSFVDLLVGGRMAQRFRDAQRILDSDARDRAEQMSRDVRRDIERNGNGSGNGRG